MNAATPPDLFTNVHKGIRRALFQACTALGSARGDARREARARALLGEALHFVAQHGDNEDVLLLPALRERAPAVVERMRAAHTELDRARAELTREQPIDALYLRASAFTAAYLAHLDEEERVLEPTIRAVLSDEAIVAFGRGSVARTAPDDQRMMLGWMLPALPRADAEALLARLPPPLASALRPLLDSEPRT